MSTVRIVGTKELVAKVRRMGDRLLPELAPAVEHAANVCITMAQINVPEKTGHLAASAFVDGPEVKPSKHSVSATCGYGVPYAGAVHEGFHYGIKDADAPSMKWLEHAVTQATGVFRSEVRKTTKAALERLAR